MPRRLPKRGRRVDATGRSIGGAQHARFYRWELESPAYRSLSLGARALLVELKALYNGSNNGILFLSCREAARRLNCNKDFPTKLFAELKEKGFIRPNIAGAFNVKVASGQRRATSWILTEFPIGDAKGVGTKDFMHWRPPAESKPTRPKNISRSLAAGQPVPCGRTDAFQTVESVRSGGTVLSISAARRSPVAGHR